MHSKFSKTFLARHGRAATNYFGFALTEEIFIITDDALQI